MRPRLVIAAGWAHEADSLAGLAASCRTWADAEACAWWRIVDEPHALDGAWGVGWSLGGLLMLRAALELGAQPRGLALIAATPRFTAAPDFACGTPAAELRALDRLARRDPASALALFRQRCAAPHPPLPGPADAPPQRLEEGLALLRDIDLRERLPALRCPLALLHGAKDVVIPPDASRWMADRVPGATLGTVPDTGHDLPQRQAEAVAAELRRFIAS